MSHFAVHEVGIIRDIYVAARVFVQAAEANALAAIVSILSCGPKASEKWLPSDGGLCLNIDGLQVWGGSIYCK